MKGIVEVFVVEPEEAGERLDKWLTTRLQDEDYDVSRNHIQNWIARGYVEGYRQRVKASDSVSLGQQFTVCVPSVNPISIVGDDISFNIVYEDSDVVVVDKPRGIVVHPAVGHPRGTLINGLIHREIQLSELGGEMRPGVVHRIDKDTSGLVMFAKTDFAYYALSEQLKAHSVMRSYQAIVHGVLMHEEGTIDAPIGRDPRNRQRMAVVGSGKPAVTHFYIQERFQDYCLALCQLETGRTHQIRVHFAYIGHPLAGDPLYGRRRTLQIGGQALHAQTLGFIHPRTDKQLIFESAMPEDMENLLESLRNEAM